MRRLPVTTHRSADEVGHRYRHCPDPKEKTRWHLVWLLLRDPTLTCERAGPLVGLSDTHARLDWTAPEDGTYVVRARAYGPSQTGAYALTIERKP